MNVLNIISSTLNKQQSTYFRKSESVISPRYQGMGLEVLQARQFSSMNRSIILDEVSFYFYVIVFMVMLIIYMTCCCR